MCGIAGLVMPGSAELRRAAAEKLAFAATPTPSTFHRCAASCSFEPSIMYLDVSITLTPRFDVSSVASYYHPEYWKISDE